LIPQLISKERIKQSINPYTEKQNKIIRTMKKDGIEIKLTIDINYILNRMDEQ